MEQVIQWFIDCIAFLVRQALSWHILGNLSLLHFIFGAILLTIFLHFITFGENNIGGTADYIGGIRRFNNRENARDRERYASKTYQTINHNTGVVTTRTSRRLRDEK